MSALDRSEFYLGSTATLELSNNPLHLNIFKVDFEVFDNSSIQWLNVTSSIRRDEDNVRV